MGFGHCFGKSQSSCWTMSLQGDWSFIRPFLREMTGDWGWGQYASSKRQGLLPESARCPEDGLICIYLQCITHLCAMPQHCQHLPRYSLVPGGGLHSFVTILCSAVDRPGLSPLLPPGPQEKKVPCEIFFSFSRSLKKRAKIRTHHSVSV